jgi:hypothetical protein
MRGVWEIHFSGSPAKKLYGGTGCVTGDKPLFSSSIAQGKDQVSILDALFLAPFLSSVQPGLEDKKISGEKKILIKAWPVSLCRRRKGPERLIAGSISRLSVYPS